MLKLIDYGMILWISPETSLLTHGDVQNYMTQRLATGDFEENLWAVRNSTARPSFLAPDPPTHMPQPLPQQLPQVLLQHLPQNLPHQFPQQLQFIES